MAGGIEFQALASKRPDLYAKLEEVRLELGSLIDPSKVTSPGTITQEALDVLERIRPGSTLALNKLASGGHVSEGEKLIGLWMKELRSEVPGLSGVRRWMNGDAYDQLQKQKSKEGTSRITITPRDFKAVAKLIKLNPKELHHLKDQRVLSVGEGASDFAQTLQTKFGAKSIATDWWYGMTREKMAEQILVGERWHDSNAARVLHPVEARDQRLPDWKVAAMGEALPFAGGTFKAVYLANVLGWYFSPDHRKRAGLTEEQGRAMIDEALRATEKGGEVRFNLFARPHAEALAAQLQDHPLVGRVVTIGSTLVLQRS